MGVLLMMMSVKMVRVVGMPQLVSHIQLRNQRFPAAKMAAR